MARIAVVGSVARDDVVKLHEPLREGAHIGGTWRGPRLGGGAACTAVPLAYAGHQVAVVASVGRDDVGLQVMKELSATGVDTSQIVLLDQPSTRSIILVNGSGERTIVNVERTYEPTPPTRLLVSRRGVRLRAQPPGRSCPTSPRAGSNGAGGGSRSANGGWRPPGSRPLSPRPPMWVPMCSTIPLPLATVSREISCNGLSSPRARAA